MARACTFFGIPLLRRHPGSVITVAQGVVFRSGVWSNYAGLNRPCYLVTLTESAHISIGEKCRLSGTVISSASDITLGQNVFCGANVTITDTDWHPLDAKLRISGGAGTTARVEIGSDVWLGMNVVVLKGVTIGRGSVIAANSLVSTSIPSGVLAAGQPARVIRKLNDAA